jgi:hypothetical protein
LSVMRNLRPDLSKYCAGRRSFPKVFRFRAKLLAMARRAA